MLTVTALQHGPIGVFDYRCNAGAGAKPYTEVHAAYSLSFVRRGSFGYRVSGKAHELVAGSVLTGYTGDEFVCTHEHHRCGDECLSLRFSAEVADTFASLSLFRLGVVPPVSRLMIAAERTEAAARGITSVSLEEAALLFAGEFSELASNASPSHAGVSALDRRRAVRAALWLDEHSADSVELAAVSKQVELSPYHFLRLFARVLGVTPHQYLVRSRLRHAARLLLREELPITEVALEVGFQDLSNFVNTFRRASGISPRAFRLASHTDRKICQDRLRALNA